MANPRTPAWSDTHRKFILGADVTLANESVTASGSTAPEQPARDDLMLELDVTNVGAGATSLDVTIETSPDDVTYTSAGAFPQQTAVNTVRLGFINLDQYVRVTYTYAGDGIGAIDFTVEAV